MASSHGNNRCCASQEEAEDDESRRRRAYLGDLLTAPLLSTQLLSQQEPFLADDASIPEQPEEAAAAALAAAGFLAARARLHLGACRDKNQKDSAPAASADAAGLGQPPRLSLWPRPPRAHRSEPVLQNQPASNDDYGAAASRDASSANLLSQLEAALSRAVHLGEEALSGVSTVALESIHMTTEGLNKARHITKFKQFEQFLLSSQAVPVSVGLVFGSGLRTVVDALCTDIISPILGTIFGAKAGDGEEDALTSLSFELFGVTFSYGHFVEVILQFLLTALLLFYLIVLPLSWLGGGNSALKYSPRKPCPTCKELIKEDALKCMFCDQRDPNGLQRRQLKSLRAVVEQIRRQQLGQQQQGPGW